ncbi:MAG: HlyD family secretion protein [Rhodocyclaceae bacterium]|nr:MAG: HlyD family secretion protein [Rhodocyclaceae bacterium]TNC98495.1 MAG: HlyD family secretion protein [Rhodocyclaceae bacterium]
MLTIALAGVMLWAYVAPISGAVIMSGKIIVASQRKTIQHLEGGIVRQILVQPGQKVAKDQPLVILDDVSQSATAVQLSDELDAALAQSARLTAEKLGQTKISFPEALKSRSADPKVASVMQNEEAFFRARLAALNESVRLTRQQIGEAQAQINSFQEQTQAAQRTIDIAKAELEKSVKLHERNFVSNTALLAARRAVAEKEEQRAAHGADLEEVRTRITGYKLQIAALYDTRSKEAAQELRDTEKKVFELREKLRPTEDALKRRVVAAPMAGEVVDLKIFSVGGVIRPGEPLMDIIPDNESLIAEGRISTRDIQQVRVGLPVEVELSAYKQRLTPLVDGRVIYVSGDALADSASAAADKVYYLVHVEISRDSLKAVGDLTLLPGMPISAFIRTRDRSAIDYLFEPVTDILRRSMRER